MKMVICVRKKIKYKYNITASQSTHRVTLRLIFIEIEGTQYPSVTHSSPLVLPNFKIPPFPNTPQN